MRKLIKKRPTNPASRLKGYVKNAAMGGGGQEGNRGPLVRKNSTTAVPRGGE